MPRPVPSTEMNLSIWPFRAVVEEILGAAQIAQAFFAGVGGEGDGARRSHLGVIQGLDHAQHHGQAAAIVADAGPFQNVALARHLDIRAFRENGVEVGAEIPGSDARPRPDARRSRCRPCRCGRPSGRVAEQPFEFLGSRTSSWNGGAGISQIRICSSMKWGSLRFTAFSASVTAGSSIGGRRPARRRPPPGPVPVRWFESIGCAYG